MPHKSSSDKLEGLRVGQFYEYSWQGGHDMLLVTWIAPDRTHYRYLSVTGLMHEADWQHFSVASSLDFLTLLLDVDDA